MMLKTEFADDHATPKFLRFVLQADAATCLAMALAHSFASGPITAFTGIEAKLLLVSGVMLFPIAAVIAWTSLREPMWPLTVIAVIAGNVGWVLASVALLVAGQTGANPLGTAYVSVQAAGVAAFAMLEFAGLRRELSTR
ncbi:MAG: hypothetical protein EKK41_23465 [Hyphomicrobiales bacterium]|nr:MAG: hypothetical protein EKK41_23465 [Hyphomicrobiales bacterium]